LIKHHALKKYREVEVKLHTGITSALDANE
jgi:hypothetical protein